MQTSKGYHEPYIVEHFIFIGVSAAVLGEIEVETWSKIDQNPDSQVFPLDRKTIATVSSHAQQLSSFDC